MSRSALYLEVYEAEQAIWRGEFGSFVRWLCAYRAIRALPAEAGQ